MSKTATLGRALMVGWGDARLLLGLAVPTIFAVLYNLVAGLFITLGFLPLWLHLTASGVWSVLTLAAAGWIITWMNDRFRGDPLLLKWERIDYFILGGIYIFMPWIPYTNLFIFLLWLAVWCVACFVVTVLDRKNDRIVAGEVGRVSNLEEIGLGRSKFIESTLRVTSTYREMRLKLASNISAKKALGAREEFAKLEGVHEDQVYVLHDADKAGHVWVRYLKERPFSTKPAWPGPDKPGTSLSSPVTVGLYPDGHSAKMYMTGPSGDDFGHWLVAGATQSGKTTTWTYLYASIALRNSVNVIICDPSHKGAAMIGELSPLLSSWAQGIPATVEMIKKIEQLVKARYDYLSSHHNRGSWFEGCGLNYIFFHIEEYASLSATKPNLLDKLIMEAAACGISLVTSTQNPDHTTVNTKVRNQYTGKTIHRVASSDVSGFGLTPLQIEKGMKPHEIPYGNPTKGRFFLDTGFVEEMYRHMPVQAYAPNSELLQSITSEYEAQPLDFLAEEILGVKPDIATRVDIQPTQELPTLKPAEKRAMNIQHEAQVRELLEEREDLQVSEIALAVGKTEYWVENYLRAEGVDIQEGWIKKKEPKLNNDQKSAEKEKWIRELWNFMTATYGNEVFFYSQLADAWCSNDTRSRQWVSNRFREDFVAKGLLASLGKDTYQIVSFDPHF